MVNILLKSHAFNKAILDINSTQFFEYH